MNKILITVLASMSLSSFAQFTVAPFGSKSGSLPPIGTKTKSGDCVGNNYCSFQLNMNNSCFGTNLRAYNADRQLKSGEDVKLDLKIKNSDGSKVDSFIITFPATLTYASEGIRQDCTPAPGVDLSTPGDKLVHCTILGTPDVTYSYKIRGWKQTKNPPPCYAGGGYKGQEYCDYAAKTVEADLQTTGATIDPKITCLYKFDDNNKISKSAASCYFPSKLEDMSSKVSISRNGTDVKSDVDMGAFVNDIKINYKGTMDSIPKDAAVKNGQLVNADTPKAEFKFTQEGRDLAVILESSKFETSNANKSYTIVAKFPGAEGFCGGFYSPLMLFFDKNYPKFNGVSTFPLYGMKDGQRVNWPEFDAPGYFLVDLKGEKSVTKDSQLFGKNDLFDNGFEALKAHDTNKDNKIDSKDKIFSNLMLWNDQNSNGGSDEGEIVSLKSKGVVSIDLNYSKRDTTKFDNRARAREKSKFTYKKNGKNMTADIFDIWMAPID